MVLLGSNQEIVKSEFTMKNRKTTDLFHRSSSYGLSEFYNYPATGEQIVNDLTRK